jgi:DNA-binding response OmpR family regulator
MKARIFVVDGEPDINLTIKTALEEAEEKNGFEVDAFDDPIVALDNFTKGVYDLLILDIKMPKMHGFELYKEIRKIDSQDMLFNSRGNVLWSIRWYIQ